MKRVVKNNYEILEIDDCMLVRTNLNGLITGILRLLNKLDANQMDDEIMKELDIAYQVIEKMDQKGIKEIYYEDCQNKKSINTISKNGDDFYINEITDAILLILNDHYIYGDLSLIDILFNENYLSVLNDYYQGKHTKESFEKALSLE